MSTRVWTGLMTNWTGPSSNLWSLVGGSKVRLGDLQESRAGWDLPRKTHLILKSVREK